MKLIKQYQLEVKPSQKIKLPFNSSILCLKPVAGEPTLFVLIDDAYGMTERAFCVVATGKECPQRFNDSHYVGSIEYKKDEAVWLHVFEER